MGAPIHSTVRARRAIVFVALAGVVGCKPSVDYVVLRLGLCDPMAVARPQRVDLELVAEDAAGVRVGDPIVRSFDVPEGAFDDGYATVFYVPGDAVAQFDATLVWHFSSGMEQTARYEDVPLPKLGKAVDLGAQGCTGTGTTGTGTGTGTTGTTGTGTGTGTGTDTGTGTGTGTAGNTGTTGTSGPGACNVGRNAYLCEVDPSTGLGTLYDCDGQNWVPANLDVACMGECQVGRTLAGCLTQGKMWACACQTDVACTSADNGCQGMNPESLHLCVNGKLVVGTCYNGCSYTDQGDYTCE